MRATTRAALAGLAGGLAMGASTAAEMRLRGRPASGVPADVLARGLEALGDRGPARQLARRLRGDEGLRRAVSWLAPWPSALAAGAAREGLAAAGLREPAATAACSAFVWLPDAALAPALGAAEPPWRWGAVELALSAGHHAAFAVAASAARALARR